MKKVAALILAVCGLSLLLTRQDGYVSWVWTVRRHYPLYLADRFEFDSMSPLDLILKVAGVAFVGVALLVWKAGQVKP